MSSLFDLEVYRQAVATAGLGLWHYDLSTGALEWSERTKALYGLADDEDVSFEKFVLGLHPDDRDQVLETFQKAIEDSSASDYKVEHRTVAPDGAIHWLIGHGRVIRDASGAPQALVGTTWDITDRKQAEIDRAESEHRLNLATRANGIGVFDCDVQTGRMIWTEQQQRLFGLEAGSFEDHIDGWWRRIHPDDAQATREALAQAMAQGVETVELAFRAVLPSGDLRELEGAARILYDAAGQPVRVLGVSTDVSPRKAAERTLRFQALLLERLTEGVSLATEDGIIRYTNKAESDLFGYAPDELVGCHLSVQDASTEEAVMRPSVRAALKTQGFWRGERRNRRKNGTEFIAAANLTLIDIEGRSHILCVQRDITVQKKLEQIERAKDQRLQLAMVASGLGDWSWNALTDSITLSSRAASFFGLQPASSITWGDLSRLLIDADRERVQSAMIAALLNDEPFDLEYRITRPDNGQTRWLAQRARAEFSAEGEAIGLSGVVRDVTDERTALERERLLAREVDHRAKNALAVVQSLVRLTPFTTKEEYVATVTGRIHAMARVHTLLSRNSWNGATIEQIVREELAPFETTGRFDIQGPDVELSLEAAQPLSLLIHELTTNASKYGALSVPTGCVRVGWSMTGDGGVQLTWTESGGPAPPVTGTSGFGTRLIRGAASQLGGVVEQEWRPSGLHCTLSIATFQTKAGPAAPPAVFSKRQRTTRLKGSRILVVEDEVLLAMETANHLAAAGATVIGPANTLSAGLSMAASEQIDGAVLDLNLGGQSAEPLLQFLTRMKVPFIVITGYETAGIQVPVLLRKPVEYPTLIEGLSEQLSKAGRRRVAASSVRLAMP